MNLTCTHCNASNTIGSRYCPQCGRPVAATTVQERTVVYQPTQVQGGIAPRLAPRSVVDQGRRLLGSEKTHIDRNVALNHVLSQSEDVMIVEDVSGSMGEAFDPGVTKIEASVHAGVNLVLNKFQIDPHDRIGLNTFNDHADVLLPLSPVGANKATIIRRLQSLKAGGGTDINEGLIAARDAFDWTHNDVVRRIVLLTDGHGGHPLRTAEDLKAKGVIIDVIGIGPTPKAVKEALLKKVASVVQGELRYRFIKDHQTLVAHYTKLAEKTKTGI